VRHEFRKSVKNEIIAVCAAAPGEFCGPLLGNDYPAFHQLANDLPAIEGNNFRSTTMPLLLNGGFCKTSERNEIARNWKIFLIFRIDGTDELIQIVATAWSVRGFAFTDGLPRFETVFCGKIKLPPGFVNVETGLLVTKRHEKVRH
jgi:hypothetical protein